MVLIQELLGFKGLTNRRYPILETQRFVYIPCYDSHACIPASASRFDIFQPGKLSDSFSPGVQLERSLHTNYTSIHNLR